MKVITVVVAAVVMVSVVMVSVVFPQSCRRGTPVHVEVECKR